VRVSGRRAPRISVSRASSDLSPIRWQHRRQRDNRLDAARRVAVRGVAPSRWKPPRNHMGVAQSVSANTATIEPSF